MALATKCPHCGTTFRVAADQLKLRGGIVRCGACQHIFDGSASLVDLDALAAAHHPQVEHHEPDAEPHAASEPVPAAVAEPAAEPEPEEIPVYEVDFNSTLDPLGILPKPETDTRPVTEAADAPSTDTEEIEVIEVIDVAGQPGLAADAQVEEAEPPAAEPPEDETIAAVDDEAPAIEALDSEALDVTDEEAPPPLAAGADAPHGHGHEAAGSDAWAVPVAEAEAGARPAGEHRQVFSMGSALLSEPDQPRASREARLEPTLDLTADEELVAAPPPYDHNEPVEALRAEADALARYAGEFTPLPMREAAESHFSAPPPAAAAPAKPRSRLGRRSKLTPTKIAPPKLRVPEIDEPEFVKRGRQYERTGKRLRILMALGSVVLALALVAQAVTTFRNDLAARFPGMKPALSGLCSVLGCRVELPARIENLTIETGDLQTLGNNTYLLTTLLHNQAGLTQAWPAIELALSDANDKPLLRRVFTPAEYLPKGVAPAAGFGPHAEQPVKLYFQLDQLTPSGYHIFVFYP
jgi:predicted Zn finger-like uncharacterized protein